MAATPVAIQLITDKEKPPATKSPKTPAPIDTSFLPKGYETLEELQDRPALIGRKDMKGVAKYKVKEQEPELKLDDVKDLLVADGAVEHTYSGSNDSKKRNVKDSMKDADGIPKRTRKVKAAQNMKKTAAHLDMSPEAGPDSDPDIMAPGWDLPQQNNRREYKWKQDATELEAHTVAEAEFASEKGGGNKASRGRSRGHPVQNKVAVFKVTADKASRGRVRPRGIIKVTIARDPNAAGRAARTLRRNTALPSPSPSASRDRKRKHTINGTHIDTCISKKKVNLKANNDGILARNTLMGEISRPRDPRLFYKPVVGYIENPDDRLPYMDMCTFWDPEEDHIDGVPDCWLDEPLDVLDEEEKSESLHYRKLTWLAKGEQDWMTEQWKKETFEYMAKCEAEDAAAAVPAARADADADVGVEMMDWE